MLSFFWIFAIISPFVANASYVATENPRLVIYGDHSGGRSMVLSAATQDFKNLRFNGRHKVDDKVSSVKAERGTWELYEHNNYQGKRMLVTEGGRISAAHNDKYSSARPVCTFQMDPSTYMLQVWEHKSEQGASTEFFVDKYNLADDDWGDKISSVRAFKGDWELYQHHDYSGDRMVIREGQQKNVDNDNHYSSLRPVCGPYSPEAMKCILTTIEVSNDVVAQKTGGTQIVGIAMDSSCAGNGVTGHLNIETSDDFNEETSIEISNSEEVNWSLTVAVGITGKAGFGGSGTEVSIEVAAGVGGSHTYSKTDVKTISQGYSQSVGHELEYPKPGVAVMVGLVDRYEINQSNVPIKMHLTCPDGTTRTKDSSMSLESTSYQSANFWTFSKGLTEDVCRQNDDHISQCMREFQNEFSQSFTNRPAAKAAFNACVNF